MSFEGPILEALGIASEEIIVLGEAVSEEAQELGNSGQPE